MTTSGVRWRPATGADDAWTELDPFPGTNGGFAERGEYVFDSPGKGWSLRIDDEPLGEQPGDAGKWRWTPGFYAGEVTAELLGPSPSNRRLFLLDVSPDAAKVGGDAFRRMVQDLWEEDPELVLGSEPATARIGELGSSQDPWLAFSRLRRYCPDFLRAADAIRARPRRALRADRASVPLHKVRNVDRYTAVGLARSSALALVLDSPDAVPAVAHDARLNVPITEETLDSAANRAMLALVIALLRRVSGVRDQLEAAVLKEQRSDTETPLAPRWPARRQVLDDLAARLKLLVRQSPFRDVRRPEITAAGLNAVSADPTYARAWGRGWRALRQGLESGETAERLWMSPTWEIYERWCFVQLGKLLQAQAPSWGWLRRKDRWIGGSNGKSAELRLQPAFPSRAHEHAGLRSISRERIPDIVLTVTSDSGTRFVVLDAKYRATRANVLDAMASAHVYQDSLRIGARRAEAALLLVPAGGGAGWLEDLAFHDEHRVGVHVLSPDAEPMLPRAVRRVLGEA
jgi:hypothetical protein